MNTRPASARPPAARASITHLLAIDDSPMAEMRTVCGEQVTSMGTGHYFVGSPGLNDVNCLRCKSAKGAA